MIRVVPQPEPAEFHKRVRKPGYRWLAKKGIAPDDAPPSARAMPDLWRRMLPALFDAYGGVCAYFCIYIGNSEFAASVDHFVPKSKRAGFAYEWRNYRLSSKEANGRKANHEGLLDPFTMPDQTFYLNLASGRMRVNPAMDKHTRILAECTLDMLALNDPKLCKMRTSHYDDYLSGAVTQEELLQFSPFVWREMNRQSLA